MSKQNIVFDFDGVIHSYKSGWQGIDVIPDPPVEGIKKEIDELRKDYIVIVQSTRCREFSGAQAISNYLEEHGIEVDGVTDQKEPAIAYIDDRAIRFDGQAKGLASIIKKFDSWTKREECEYCQKVEDKNPITGSEFFKWFDNSNDSDNIKSCLIRSKSGVYSLHMEHMYVYEDGEEACDEHSNVDIPMMYCPICGRYLG